MVAETSGIRSRQKKRTLYIQPEFWRMVEKIMRDRVVVCDGNQTCPECDIFKEGEQVAILTGDSWDWMCKDCAVELGKQLQERL